MKAAVALKVDEDGFSPIVSSNLESAKFDEDTKVITVRFQNGNQYEYPGCDAKLWKDFSSQFDGQKGRSAGKFMHTQLSKKPYARIDDWK